MLIYLEINYNNFKIFQRCPLNFIQKKYNIFLIFKEI